MLVTPRTAPCFSSLCTKLCSLQSADAAAGPSAALTPVPPAPCFPLGVRGRAQQRDARGRGRQRHHRLLHRRSHQEHPEAGRLRAEDEQRRAASWRRIVMHGAACTAGRI
jgi:hypothetical protein